MKSKKLSIWVIIGILTVILVSACGKKSGDSQPQTQQSIVPANVFAQIPGQKIGN